VCRTKPRYHRLEEALTAIPSDFRGLRRSCRDEPWTMILESLTSSTHLGMKLNSRDFVLGCHRCLYY
jgi:hypothetical protein